MKLKRITGKLGELFYISSISDLDRKLLYPQVPINKFTKNKFEDWKTKRIVFYPTIDKALMGLDQNLTGMTLYVYSPIGISKESLIKPDISMTPKSFLTDEYWYLQSVELRLLGSLVINKRGKERGFRYGPRQTEGKLYEWDWKENLKPWEKKKLL